MKTEHNNIEIEYREETNRWHFELRGRQRSCESLAKAKESIDAPVKSDEKPFARIKAIYLRRNGNEEASICEVTSIADSTGYRGQQVWIMIGKERSKISLSECLPHTEENLAKIAQIKELRIQSRAIDKKADEVRASMKPIEV